LNLLTHQHQDSSVPDAMPAISPEIPMGDHCAHINDPDTLPSNHLLNRAQDLDIDLCASVNPSDLPVDSDTRTLEIPDPVDVPSGDIEDIWA
jgi:hypothetical protein